MTFLAGFLTGIFIIYLTQHCFRADNRLKFLEPASITPLKSDNCTSNEDKPLESTEETTAVNAKGQAIFDKYKENREGWRERYIREDKEEENRQRKLREYIVNNINTM